MKKNLLYTFLGLLSIFTYALTWTNAPIDDDIQFASIAQTAALPLDFELDASSYTLNQFGNAVLEIAADPADGSNNALKMTRPANTDWWSGGLVDLDTPVDATTGSFSMRVYSTQALGYVELKLEQDANNVVIFNGTHSGSGWETLTFAVADGATTGSPSAAATVVVTPRITNDGGSAVNPTSDEMYFFDDIQVATTPPPPPTPPSTENKIVFPVDFECEYIDYAFTEFGGAPTELADNPSKTGINTSDKVAQLTKSVDAAWWAGSFFDMENPIDFTIGTELKVKVYSPKAGINVRLKLEQIGNGAVFQELDATVSAANTWEELTYNFTGGTNAMNLQRVVIFFDFDVVNETPGDGSVYYYDMVSQTGNTGMTDCQAPTDPTESAITPPSCDQIMSIYSDAYMDLAGTNFDPNWDGDTGTVPSEEMINGDSYYKYSNFNFQGIELASAVDATAMTHLHVDIWSAADATANIFPISVSTGEQAFAMNLMGQQWNSFDIPLSHFTDLAFTDIHQFKFDGGTGNEIFMDNLYFYGDCNVVPACPTMVWSDEFDGSSLNTGNWEQQIGDGTAEGIPGWGNNELQYYQAGNTTVAGGKLTITAKEESVGGKAYTSSRIRTKDLQDFTYGRMEASIKLPIGQGLWPAFWMLSTDEVYGGWPRSGEIDIMEYLGHEPEKAFGTIHYGDFAPNNKFTSGEYFLPDGTFNDDFHEFAIEWDENVIRWYIDDILYSTKTPTDIAPEFWPFNQDFHFLLNIAVGGNLPGSPNASTVFPQTMEVDYVRVYKGQFPYINGNQLVANKAAGEVYTVGNAPAGSTYTWTVPAGATITSGDGTASITVDWGNTSGLQDITVAVAGPCTTENMSMMVKVDIERVEILECALENFDTESLLNLTSVSNQGETGTLEDNATNPAPNDVNSSSLVGKYTRSTNQFDNFQYSTSAIMDAAKFASTTPDKKFYIDIYTTAAPGKVLTLQLENTAKIGSFPAGRHSRYTATTTVQNAWQRLEFKFDARLDGNVLDNEVDNIVFLFDANTNNTDTYYFDNFDKFCTSSVGECATVAPCSSSGACGISNLQASSCPNGTIGTELITVRVADDPSCFQSIEVPVCSDGSMVDITFDYNEVSFAPSVSTTIFELLVDGQVVATGGTDIGDPKIQFGGIITPKSGAAGGVAATGSTTPMASVADPCNCADQGNILNANGTIRLFRDELTFTGTGAVVCTGNCGVFLDATGNPITNFGNAPGSVEFFRVPGNYSSSTFTIGGVVATLNGGTCTDSCQEPIPTMSQWGLIIFGLLMLNLGVFFVGRKEFDQKKA